jgi:tetratricopeptide (TPR) repeat protein
MEAWEYFQKGKYYWYNYFDFDGHLKSAQMFEKACELDTNFALAFAWQALEYMAVYRRSEANQDVYLQKYKIAIQKAEAFQPIIPEVNIAKGVYFYNAKNDLVEALKEGEMANSKRPNDPFILMQLGNFYLDNRNYLKALELYEKAFELDPRSIKIPVNASRCALALDRFNEAERWTDIVIANSPETSVGYENKLDIIINVLGDLKSAEELLEDAKKNVTMEKFRLAYWDFLISFYKRDYSKSLIQNEKIFYWWKLYNKAYLLKLLNRDREARVYFDSLRIVCQQFFKNQPNAINAERTINLALAYAGLGERTKALNEIAKLDSTTIIYNSRDLAYFYIMLGDNNSALQSLQNTISAPIRLYLGELNLDPLLDPLRSDPRFKKIIAMAEERIKKAQQ